MIKKAQITQTLQIAHHFILHINNYFTLFLSLVPYCIGYISVLAWQAAEVAAGSPTQAF